jgi:hypothetical protein
MSILGGHESLVDAVFRRRVYADKPKSSSPSTNECPVLAADHWWTRH